MANANANRELEYQSLRHGFLAEKYGVDLAFFYCCAAFDVPYLADVCEEYDWIGYRRYLDETSGGRSRGFEDGETDVAKVLIERMTDEDRWARVWGEGDPKNPYTEADYKRLDELFRTYSARLVAAGGYDAQQEDTLRSCCKMRLLADKCLASGTKDGVSMHGSLNKTIQDALSSENLRRKDAKPIESLRLDGIIEAFRKKHGAKLDLSFEEAAEICAKWLVSHRYPMTADAADHMLLSIVNMMRINQDASEFNELPNKARIPKGNLAEFAAEPNDQENEAYDYLRLKRNNKPRTDIEEFDL